MSRIVFVAAVILGLCLCSSNYLFANTDIERIQVTASKNLTQSKLNLGNESTIDIENIGFVLQKVSDGLLYVPGVTVNGQGGLWQSYNIRGLARWRVKSLVDGININTDRRAGNSLSFIDPNLLSSVDVISGPSSVYYGSGAIGGVINANFKKSDLSQLSASYNSFGNENSLSITTAINDDLYTGIAYRHANNGESQSVEPLLSQFEQYSSYLSHSANVLDDLLLDISVIGSYGLDIGKTNNQYPESRISFYPFEKHLLGKVAILEIEKWAVGTYFHDQDWQSDTLRINKRRNVNDYSSFDWGTYGQKFWEINNVKGRIGLDSDIRSNVKITEKQYTTSEKFQWRKTILKGDEYRGAFYADVNFNDRTVEITAGTRLEYIKQSNLTTVSDQFTTGFIKLSLPFHDHSNISIDLGTGFRFPTLTERFFNGSSARANIIGNENLSPENSKNVLVSYQLSTEGFQLRFNSFYNQIDNYIERVLINTDTLTYQNETSAFIYGGEMEYNSQLSENLSLNWIYQVVKGHNYQQKPLADIPPAESRLLLMWTDDDWQATVFYRYRASFSSPASGETNIDSANIINLSGHYSFTDSLKLKVDISNITNEFYIATTDDNANVMAGQEWSMEISWTF